MKTSPYCSIVNLGFWDFYIQLRISYFGPTLEKELVWVNAIEDSIPKEGKPVKDNRRLIGVFP